MRMATIGFVGLGLKGQLSRISIPKAVGSGSARCSHGGSPAIHW